MNLQAERAVAHEPLKTVNSKAPRGGSYVTMPADQEVPPRVEGSYVTLPGVFSGGSNRAQGSYVTHHSAPAGDTEISYTRVG